LQVISTSTDGTPYNLAGFDGAGGTYSYNQLGNGSVTYAGTIFTLGSPTVPNSITNGAVYTLPAPGSYSTVYLLGAAITPGQINQPFKLTYATGAPATVFVNMSSWAAPAGYAGESVVASTTHKNTQAGGQVAGTFDLYGYQLPVDSSRTLLSVTLPSTRNVVIMALGFGTSNQVVVPGAYVYTPPAGTVLTVGTHTLDVVFTPTNTSGYTGATGSTTIVVTKATPILNWPTPAAIAVGTPLSGIQLDATASFQGVSLPGTFTYTPPANTVLSAGTHTLSVLFTPTDTTDFNTATATVQIQVGNAGSPAVISGAPVFSNGDCCFFSQPTPYNITVTGTPTAPTGTVAVIFNGQTIGTGVLTPGSGSSFAGLLVTSSVFLPGNNSVTLSYLGDANFLPTSIPATIALRNPAIGANSAILGDSITTLVPYTFSVAGAININFNPHNAPSTDFKDAGSGTCQPGVQELAGAVCSISVAFKPSLPGARKGAVEVDFVPASGNPSEPTLYLFFSGMGDAAQIALSSAQQSILNSSLNQPQSVTFDPTDITNSKLYVANSNMGQIDTLPSAGGALTQWNVANTGNLVYPSDLVYDAFDNLVVSDTNAAKVFSFNPALAETTVSTGTFTLGVPTAVKVDFGGNLFIADAGATPRLIEVPGEAYSPSVVNLGSQSVSFPQALAVDNTGSNLYVGDGDLNQILQIGLSGTGSTTTVSQFSIAPCDATVTTCALNSPAGFAFDPNGDMFITDSSQRVLMVPSTHAAPQNSPTTLVPITGLVNPTGITLDGSGNIYVSDLNGTVTKLWVNTGALSLTTLGSSLTTKVTNTGDLYLSITSLTFANGGGSAFSQTNTCAAAIAPGASCTITVTYSQAGPATDTLKIQSNAFSASGVTVKLTHN
jgi:sugar lactone lactonase YvrE